MPPNPCFSRAAARRALALATALLGLAGCAANPPRVDGVAGASLSPAVPWTPPPAAREAIAPTLSVVPLAEARERLARLTLAEVVDLALHNSPDTRAVWADAKAAAARYGSERGAWYPALNGSASLERGNAADAGWTTAYGGSARLSYLLFDFGGRAGAVDEAKETSLAASWTHNAAIQDKVLDVEVAFFSYAGAKAILEANRTSLAEAESSLAAAEARHEVGLATIADVLQARTARSQVRLDVQATEGQLRTTRGALAVTMGYPANVPCDVVLDTPEIPAASVARDVDALVETAVGSRPDLQAARARARAAAAAARSARSDLLPSLSLTGSAGRNWIDGAPDPFDRYAGALVLDVPLFSGFSRRYDLRAARAEAEAAQERARSYEQQVIYEVFAAHSDLLTATERVTTTDDLLASALESERVAMGRYREGVGDILDLLSAQRALASARALQINARLGWFTALARLARDAGVLEPSGRSPLAPDVLQPEVKP